MSTRWAIVTVGVTGVLLTLVALLMDTGLVNQARVLTLGWPLPWLTQDLAGFDPPVLPYSHGLASPWEHPSGIGVMPLLNDIAILGAAGLGLTVVVRRLTRRSGSSRFHRACPSEWFAVRG